MMEFLNSFFTSTYEYSKLFHEIRLLAVMSLAGIGLGLIGRCSPRRWKKKFRKNAVLRQLGL